MTKDPIVDTKDAFDIPKDAFEWPKDSIVNTKDAFDIHKDSIVDTKDAFDIPKDAIECNKDKFDETKVKFEWIQTCYLNRELKQANISNRGLRSHLCCSLDLRLNDKLHVHHDILKFTLHITAYN